jgi:signal transduction histidine kinase
MADAPDWPKVLSLAVHEFRTPLTVVAGYLRMLSTDRVGAISDAQRRVIEEAEKSCGRISGLLNEVSEVAHFHQGRLTFLRTPVAVSRVINSIELPAAPDGRRIELSGDADRNGAEITGDATRLGRALSAVAAAVARETIDSDTLHVRHTIRESPQGRELFIAMGSETVAHEILGAPAGDLSAFDATRGGSGLSLVIARQVLEEHQGRLYGAAGERTRAGAAIALPLSS